MSTSARHDRLLTHVAQEGDTASELAERLTVENFREASGFERDVVAFRKLRTDAWVSAARSFLARRKGEPMSDEKQKDIRTIEQVTDDEIVDAIARRGFAGIDLDDTYDGNGLQQICIELGLATLTGPTSCEQTDIDTDLAQHIHELCTGDDDARLCIDVSNFVWLTPREWARRLSFCTEDEIYKMLAPQART